MDPTRRYGINAYRKYIVEIVFKMNFKKAKIEKKKLKKNKLKWNKAPVNNSPEQRGVLDCNPGRIVLPCPSLTCCDVLPWRRPSWSPPMVPV